MHCGPFVIAMYLLRTCVRFRPFGCRSRAASWGHVDGVVSVIDGKPVLASRTQYPCQYCQTITDALVDLIIMVEGRVAATLISALVLRSMEKMTLMDK